MGRLEGKVALITGAAQGQGEAEARLFAREGASVVVADVLAEMGEAVAAEINDSGGHALFVPLDVSCPEQWAAAVKKIDDAFGRLDILVNNAAIWRPEATEDISEADWDTMFAINSKGPFLGTKAALPLLRKGRGPAIVNIASASASKGAKGATAYCAAKAALANFTRSTAIQYGPEGIRANVIHPGPINTEMLRTGMQGNHESAAAALPIGRLGLPEDIAYGVLFLASDEAAFVTGSELLIDGGLRA